MSENKWNKTTCELQILKNCVIGRFNAIDGNCFKDQIILDLTVRPQILVNDSLQLLAVFLDKETYEGIIKMIKSLKGGDDFGIIEIAKLWKSLKPFLEKMEIKTS